MPQNNDNNADSFQITTDIILTDFSGNTHSFSGKNSKVSVLNITIFESIEFPYMQAELNVVDIGFNLISEIPITGMEKITFGIKTPYFSDQEYKFDFRIYSVSNRTAYNKMHQYTLNLISFEGLQNEMLRIGKVMQGYGHEMVQKIMKETFKTKKKIDITDVCLYKLKLIPRNLRPFEFIHSILSKCIPKSIGSKTPAATTIKNLNPQHQNSNQQSDVTPKENLFGSAGYFFWETYDGYIFKSIDALCNPLSEKTIPEYAYKNYNPDPGHSIIEYQYTTEIDLMKKFRAGTYSSMIVFFNPSSGIYQEFLYDINSSYKKMNHLGKDETIPPAIQEFSKYPTRIMTQFPDSETYYNGAGIPDYSDYPDYRQHYMCQSIARKFLLKNQELHITVTGNLSLRAGDKIKVLLPNYLADNLKSPSEQYDKMNSGLYLIKSISYSFSLKNNDKINTGQCDIFLIRDSLGAFTL
jgi:hypothetical protein